ncbi:MAG: 2-isopropylmalate synthase [bacterium]
METIRIFDTTLRDGEQAPGFSMSAGEKLALAKQLERLGVDVIEAGFAASSPGDFESVRSIACELKRATVVSLCRASRDDIDKGVEALKEAKNWGIHTFISTSPLHMKYKLQMDPEDVLKAAVDAVAYAKKFTDNVEFSTEDATRSEPEFLIRVLSEAVRAGAVTLNIPDTVGYTTPGEFFELITRLKNEVYNSDQVVFSVHCHNDLGLGVANSLSAMQAGARQVECTINGIGERAGNASMEELVMALKTRQQIYNFDTNIVTEQLYPTSKLLQQITGVGVQPNKAIVGANAFAHEAGIHQHGVLKNALTYEIMTPQSVGIKASNLVLGKHSGRHALSDRIRDLGYELNDVELNQVFKEFKRLADVKKQVFDEDLEALVTHGLRKHTDRYVLEHMTVTSGTEAVPTATVVMRVDGDLRKKAGFGDGPVDSALNTIKDLTGIQCRLTSYVVKAITGGTDAQGEVSIGVDRDGLQVVGRGAHTDIVIASAMAFINALNRLDARVGAISHMEPVRSALGGV